MKIQTFQSNATDISVSTNAFLDQYEENIVDAIIPPTNLPVFVTNFQVSASSGTTIQYSCLSLNPTNVFSKRVWDIVLRGSLPTGATASTITLDFAANPYKDIYDISFEGELGGTFVIDQVVYDASKYWRYVYDPLEEVIQFHFEDVGGIIGLVTSPKFQLMMYIEDVIGGCTHSSYIDTLSNVIVNKYCVHNRGAGGSLGGLAVSGDFRYTDYNQDVLVIPTFLGSGYKLLLTVTSTNLGPPPPYVGITLLIDYVGGALGSVGYITTENKTNFPICVKVRSNGGIYTVSALVPPGTNTVDFCVTLSDTFIYFDGANVPC